MSQTVCTPCESVLSCSDSRLSVTGNVIGILTFAYAVVLGTFIVAIQLNGSSANIKRFGKTVAFLKPRINRLQTEFNPDLHHVTKRVTATYRGKELEGPHKNFEDRLATLIADFGPLLDDIERLWPKGEREFEVNIWRRIRWLWNQADMKVRLSEVEPRFTELLSYAEK